MIYVSAPEGDKIGLGHVRRCQILKTELSRYTWDRPVMLLDYPDLPEDTVTVARQNGIAVVLIEGYRGAVAPHVLIDSNFCYLDKQESFPWAETVVCLGPDYALLPEEYRLTTINPIEHKFRRLLITLGGSDAHKMTEKLCQWLIGHVEQIRVIIGPHFPSMELSDVDVRRNVSSLREHLLWCDAVICGGGQTLFEVCRLKVPAIVIEMAKDQQRGARTLGKLGATLNLGPHQRVQELHVQRLVDAIKNYELRTKLRSLMPAVDGQGSRRCAEVIAKCR